jgi:hypothetical protein
MNDIDDIINLTPRGHRQQHHAITPENMSDNLASELVADLDDGDFEVNDWEADFLESCLSRDTFSIKQKSVIYKMAKRFGLL